MPTTIPSVRLDQGEPGLLSDILERVARLASEGAFIGGAEVEGFEAEFASYCGAAHAVGLSSGTDALALGLRALGVGCGDEVIVPANSFIATAEAVTMVGATPRFVDVDPDTALLTADTVAPHIGPRTRGVIPVHLWGRTVDMAPLIELCRGAGLAVLEDACQAHGAMIGDRRAGTVGDAGCFSFYPTKNLGAWGDAGALVTNDASVAERVRLLRSHGERPRYVHHEPGYTARLDALQAAVLRIKLRRLDDWNGERRRLAGALTAALHGSAVATPAPVKAGRDHVFHQYVVISDDRGELRAHLERCGVATAVHYPVPIHRTGAYAHPGSSALPVSESLSARICSLPLYPGMSLEEVSQVAAAVHAFSPVAA